MGRRGHDDRKSRAQNVDATTMAGRDVNIPVLNTNNLIFSEPIAFILKVIYLDYFLILLIERGLLFEISLK